MGVASLWRQRCLTAPPPSPTLPQPKSDLSDFGHSKCRTRVNPSSDGGGSTSSLLPALILYRRSVPPPRLPPGSIGVDDAKLVLFARQHGTRTFVQVERRVLAQWPDFSQVGTILTVRLLVQTGEERQCRHLLRTERWPKRNYPKQIATTGIPAPLLQWKRLRRWQRTSPTISPYLHKSTQTQNRPPHLATSPRPQGRCVCYLMPGFFKLVAFCATIPEKSVACAGSRR